MSNLSNPPGPLIIFIGFHQEALLAASELGFGGGVIFHSDSRRPKKKLLVENEKLTKFSLSYQFDNLEKSHLNILKNKIKKLNLKLNLKLINFICLSEKGLILSQKLQMLFKLNDELIHSEKTTLLCHNKELMKMWAKKNDISVTDFVSKKHLPQNNQGRKITFNPVSIFQNLGPKVILKEKTLSGSRSIVECSSVEDVKKIFHSNILAERKIYGQEYSVESFILKGKIIWHNITFYYSPGEINILPAPMDRMVQLKIQKFNEKIIESFNITHGITHVEIYLTTKGLLLGELTLRPPGGKIMNLIEMSYGFNPWKILIMINTASEIDPTHITSQLSHIPQDYGVSYLIHPEKHFFYHDLFKSDLVKEKKKLIFEGVKNMKVIQDLPHFHAKKILLKRNSEISAKGSVNEYVGYIILRGKHYHSLISSLEKSRKTLDWKIKIKNQKKEKIKGIINAKKRKILKSRVKKIK
jgi:hypothetical protein